MQLILYFTSYGAVLVLFVSAIVVVCWVFIKLIQAAIRRYFIMTDPQLKSAIKRSKSQRYLHHAPHLKRAGQ